jgi:hypothetical protein
MLYSAPAPTFPSVLVIDIAPEYRGVSLALRRYYPVIIESDEEAREFERFLSVDRPGPCAPDLLDLRPSAVSTEKIIIALYASPGDGWPWAWLCSWPLDLLNRVEQAADFARGSYTVELFESEVDTINSTEQLLRTLRAGAEVKIEFLPGELVHPPGQA